MATVSRFDSISNKLVALAEIIEEPPDVSPEEFIADVKRIAAALNAEAGQLTRADYDADYVEAVDSDEDDDEEDDDDIDQIDRDGED